MCHITDNITYKTGQSQQRIDNGKYVGQTQSGMTYGSMGTDSSPAHHSGQPLCCISGDISLWPMFPLDSSLQSATSSLQSHPLTGCGVCLCQEFVCGQWGDRLRGQRHSVALVSDRKLPQTRSYGESSLNWND